MHAAPRFGSRANSESPRGFASPPRSGFAVIGRFAGILDGLSLLFLLSLAYLVGAPAPIPRPGTLLVPHSGTF